VKNPVVAAMVAAGMATVEATTAAPVVAEDGVNRDPIRRKCGKNVAVLMGHQESAIFGVANWAFCPRMSVQEEGRPGQLGA
jgi:hypothetical protein